MRRYSTAGASLAFLDLRADAVGGLEAHPAGIVVAFFLGNGFQLDCVEALEVLPGCRIEGLMVCTLGLVESLLKRGFALLDLLADAVVNLFGELACAFAVAPVFLRHGLLLVVVLLVVLLHSLLDDLGAHGGAGFCFFQSVRNLVGNVFCGRPEAVDEAPDAKHGAAVWRFYGACSFSAAKVPGGFGQFVLMG